MSLKPEHENLLEEKTRRLEILNRVGNSLASELDLERLVQTVTDAGREVTGAAFGAFFYNIKNEKGESYTLYTLSGAPREAFSKFPMPRNTAIFDPTFKGTGIIRIDDVLQDPRYGKNAPYHGMPKGHLPVRSYLAVPVISRSGDVLGGLFFGHPEPGIFSKDAEDVMAAIASQAAVAIDNANLYRSVKNELAAQVRTREALAESEARFKAVLDHCSTMVFIKDTHGKYIQINRHFEKIFQVTQDKIVGKTDFDLFSKETAEQFRANDLTVQREGQPIEVEETVTQADGPHSYISIKFPLRQADGTIYAIAGISTDITERKRNEEASRRLAAIVDSSDDAIVGKDLHGIIHSWNAAAGRIFGYAADEIIGRPVLDLIPLDRQNEEHQILSRIRRGDRVDHFETIRQRKDGSLIDVSITTSPIKDETGKIIGASKIARDISGRKEAERRQKVLYDLVTAVNRAAESSEIFELAIEAICRSLDTKRASILLYDPDGVMRFKASRGLSEEYQRAVEGHSPWTPESVDPQPIGIADVADDSAAKKFRAIFQRENIRALAFIPLTYEGRLLGKFMIYHDHVHHFTEAEFHVALTICTQVAFAVQRKISGEALEKLVNERTASLREAIAQMEEFSYSVSHDLRSPLRTIKGYAQALTEDFSATLGEEGREYLERILSSSTRMEQLIHDVLTYSRVSRMDVTLQTVSLEKLVHDLLRQYPEFEPARADIFVQPNLPAIIGHEPSLGQCIANLLNNAVKFVAPGVKPSIRITAETREAFTTLRIKDNGIGIPPEFQHRLFSMFERIHPENTYEGTGIGLAIVRKAVERMGGKVGVISDGKTGTEFWISLRSA
ncbi:MAG TPA: PAS domain S-box protein [Verrucomicrobiae bacterium]|nr:PAS domain S-box protein [Verrucomicrobiae bacterium]